jgi:hypothetical protein
MIIRETHIDGLVYRISGQLAPPDFLPQAKPAFKLTNGSTTVFVEATLEAEKTTYATYRCEADAVYMNWTHAFGWYVPGAFVEAASYPTKFGEPSA